jgi:hypothetical protein
MPESNAGSLYVARGEAWSLTRRQHIPIRGTLTASGYSRCDIS